jgi:hypothetical protein
MTYLELLQLVQTLSVAVSAGFLSREESKTMLKEKLLEMKLKRVEVKVEKEVKK